MNSISKNIFGFRRAVSGLILLCFVTGQVFAPSMAVAQTIPGVNLPMPGSMVGISPSYVPIAIKGIKVFPDNPFRFDFILDTGNSKFEGQKLQDETNLLIKYFLAALTVPDDDQWVNLSPYEKDRVIPNEFGITEMGRDLLAQDYLLKQLTASLIYPEHELGKTFWERVYKKAYEKYGDVDVPMSTFNKVWVMPDHAKVYESGNMAFITESHLKVMLDSDYVALANQMASAESFAPSKDMVLKNEVGESVIREVVLPEIEKEINEGKNFGKLRQIYHSMIMAAWFKRKLMSGMLGKVYVGANKVAGVDVEDKEVKQKIYDQYLAAFKQGVYNYIREEYDEETKETTPRKYFSGGVVAGKAVASSTDFEVADSPAELSRVVASSSVGRLITAAIGLSSVFRKTPKEDGASEILKNPHKHLRVYNEKIVAPSVYAKVPAVAFSFKDFMDQSLHNPKWGYYAAGRVRFGDEQKDPGDFVTFPDLMSPFFGRLVAQQAYKMWDGMKKAGTLADGEPFYNIEFGAGNASLAYDFLEFLQTQAQQDSGWKEFAKILKYRIYERSSALRDQQSQKLKPFGSSVEILDGDARKPLAMLAPKSVKGLVFSNELPDAFGVHKVIFNPAQGVETAFVLPSVDRAFMDKLKADGVPDSILNTIGEQSVNTHQELSLSDENIYLTPETFTTLMDTLSGFAKATYESYVKSMKFSEVYIPVNFVPEVVEHIKNNFMEFASGLTNAKQETVHYINADEESFIEGVGQVLKAGYVITIDYGNSLAELLKTESSGADLKNFRVYQSGLRQQSYNPYMAVTLQDMTTDQDFTAMATAGQKAGLKVVHFGSQGDLTRGTPMEWGVVGGLMSFDISQLRNYAKWDKAKMVNGQHQFFHGTNFKMLVQQQAGTDPDYNVFRDLNEPPLITSQPLAADDPRVLFLQQALGVSASSAVGDLLTAATKIKGIDRVLIPLLGKFELTLFSPMPSDPLFYRNTDDRLMLTSALSTAVESKILQVLKLKGMSQPLSLVPASDRQRTVLARAYSDFVANSVDAVLMKLDGIDDAMERVAATKAAKISFSYREDAKSGQFEAVLSDPGNGISAEILNNWKDGQWLTTKAGEKTMKTTRYNGGSGKGVRVSLEKALEAGFAVSITSKVTGGKTHKFIQEQNGTRSVVVLDDAQGRADVGTDIIMTGPIAYTPIAGEGASADNGLDNAASSASAAVTEQDVGGIDMNSKALDLQTEGDGIKFDMPFDPTQLQNIQIDGFSPVILQIIPTNLPLFIGVKDTDESLQVSSIK